MKSSIERKKVQHFMLFLESRHSSWITSTISAWWRRRSISTSLVVGRVKTLIAATILLLLLISLTLIRSGRSTSTSTPLSLPLSIASSCLSTSTSPLRLVSLIRGSGRVARAVVAIGVVARRRIIWTLLSLWLLGIVIWRWCRLTVLLTGSGILIHGAGTTTAVIVEVRLSVASLLMISATATTAAAATLILLMLISLITWKEIKNCEINGLKVKSMLNGHVESFCSVEMSSKSSLNATFLKIHMEHC